MKIKAIAVSLLAFLLVACGPSSAPVKAGVPTTPPQVPSSVVLTLEAIEIACAAATPEVSQAAAAWLAECPAVVTTAVDALQTTGAASKAAVIVSGIQQFLAAAPTTGTTPKDQQIINSIVAAASAFIAIYQQQVAIAANYAPPAYAESFLAVSKWQPSKADKKKLAEIKKNLKAIAKRFPKKK